MDVGPTGSSSSSHHHHRQTVRPHHNHRSRGSVWDTSRCVLWEAPMGEEASISPQFMADGFIGGWRGWVLLFSGPAQCPRSSWAHLWESAETGRLRGCADDVSQGFSCLFLFVCVSTIFLLWDQDGLLGVQGSQELVLLLTVKSLREKTVHWFKPSATWSHWPVNHAALSGKPLCFWQEKPRQWIGQRSKWEKAWSSCVSLSLAVHLSCCHLFMWISWRHVPSIRPHIYCLPPPYLWPLTALIKTLHASPLRNRELVEGGSICSVCDEL